MRKALLCILGIYIILYSLSFVHIGQYRTRDYVKSLIAPQSNLDTLVVDATVYGARTAECDSMPNITADGTVIDTLYNISQHILAVSRDLLISNGGKLEYGDHVTVICSDSSIGSNWTVHDTMHKRWKNKIDFLVKGRRLGKWSGVIVIKWRKGREDELLRNRCDLKFLVE